MVPNRKTRFPRAVNMIFDCITNSAHFLCCKNYITDANKSWPAYLRNNMH